MSQHFQTHWHVIDHVIETQIFEIWVAVHEREDTLGVVQVPGWWWEASERTEALELEMGILSLEDGKKKSLFMIIEYA